MAMALALAVAAGLTLGVTSQTMDPRVYNGFRRHPADSPAALGSSLAAAVMWWRLPGCVALLCGV